MMRRLAHTRLEQLEQIVRVKRRVHPELRRPLTWSAFKTVCDRESVVVQFADMNKPACLFSVDGTWVILIARSAASPMVPGAHELGHLWAHVDQEPLGRYEATYYMDVDWANDPREEEADVIAGLLLIGPRQPVD